MILKAGGKAILIFGAVAIAAFVAVKFDVMAYLKPKATVAATVPTVESLNGADQATAPSGAAPVRINVERASGDYTANVLTIAWNAMSGLSYANGGASTAANSLMDKAGVKLNIERQDAYDQIISQQVKFAAAVAKGDNKPKEGAAFAVIMGDGFPAYIAGAQEALSKAAPGQQLQVIGALGYSRGEDKCVIDKAATVKGSLIAGVLGDGDINICIQYAADNGLAVNADQKTYDPNAMNFVGVSSFVDGDQKFISGATESRINVVTGKADKIKVNGSATWTPGDVNVARKRGNIRVLASTKEYMWQMPSILIGNKQWMEQNSAFVNNLLAAAFQGGELVRSNEQALQQAGKINAAIFKEEDGPYWAKYFKGATENGVSLGGSTTNGLGDNLYLFGLNGNDNLYKRIYTVFGNVSIKYFPEFLKTLVPYEQVVNTSYLKQLAAVSDVGSLAVAKPTYDPAAQGQSTFAKKAVNIEFETGKLGFTPKAVTQLNEILDSLSVSGLSVQINGHTDNVGNSEANQLLSKRRADAVKTWIMNNAGSAFPEARMRTRGYGDAQPVAENASAMGRAQNRRVEIVLLTTSN